MSKAIINHIITFKKLYYLWLEYVIEPMSGMRTRVRSTLLCITVAHYSCCWFHYTDQSELDEIRCAFAVALNSLHNTKYDIQSIAFQPYLAKHVYQKIIRIIMVIFQYTNHTNTNGSKCYCIWESKMPLCLK